MKTAETPQSKTIKQKIKFIMERVCIVCAVCAVALMAWFVFFQPIVRSKPIHKAAERGDLPKLQELLKQGTFIDLEGPYEKTPLYIALENRHIEMAKFLLDRGASVNGVLQVAIYAGDTSILQTVITRGERVSKDSLVIGLISYVNTARIDKPASKVNLDIVYLLLKSGADINAKDSWESAYSKAVDGSSFEAYAPLHIASYLRDYALVEYLVKNGADVNSVTAHGATPLTIAETGYSVGDGTAGPGVHYYKVVHGSPAIAAFLRNNGAK